MPMAFMVIPVAWLHLNTGTDKHNSKYNCGYSGLLHPESIGYNYGIANTAPQFINKFLKSPDFNPLLI